MGQEIKRVFTVLRYTTSQPLSPGSNIGKSPKSKISLTDMEMLTEPLAASDGCVSRHHCNDVKHYWSSVEKCGLSIYSYKSATLRKVGGSQRHERKMSQSLCKLLFSCLPPCFCHWSLSSFLSFITEVIKLWEGAPPHLITTNDKQKEVG